MRSDTSAVAEIGRERQHLQCIEETGTALQTALQFETYDTTAAAHLLFSNGMLRMAFQQRVFHPGDVWITFQCLCQRECTLGMAGHTDVQGFQALAQHPSVEW